MTRAPPPRPPSSPLAIIATALVLTACGRAPTRVQIIDDVSADGAYTLRDADILTLTDIGAVTGGVGETFGGATFALDQVEYVDGAVSRTRVVQDARPVRARTIASGGVAVPVDFDALGMLTTYIHIESASLFFRDLGVTSASDVVPIYYQPTLEDPEGVAPTSDNAAFFRPIDAIFVLPMRALQQIPFGMNPGVLAHEYAHRVWYFEAWGGELFSLLGAAFADDLAGAKAIEHRIQSTEEGVSDYFGAAITGDPRYLDASIDAEFYAQIAAGRDMTVLRVLNADWLAGDQPIISGAFFPYAAGAVVSSTLWAFSDISGRDAVTVAVLRAERQLSQRLHQHVDFAYGELAADVIAALPASDHSALCDRARQAYEVAWQSFAGVCP